MYPSRGPEALHPHLCVSSAYEKPAWQVEEMNNVLCQRVRSECDDASVYNPLAQRISQLKEQFDEDVTFAQGVFQAKSCIHISSLAEYNLELRVANVNLPMFWVVCPCELKVRFVLGGPTIDVAIEGTTFDMYS